MNDAEYAAELRSFARRLRAVRFRGIEAYLADLDELAGAMIRRANEIGAERPQAARAPEHRRLTVQTSRIVGPTGAVATVALRRRRVG